jgi:hypothetical protein
MAIASKYNHFVPCRMPYRNEINQRRAVAKNTKANTIYRWNQKKAGWHASIWQKPN